MPSLRPLTTLSALSLVLICVASLAGLTTPDLYASETVNWRLQSLGQDLIDLVIIIPALAFGILLTTRENNFGVKLLAGVHVYVVYTFIIYCFDVRFNFMFLVYTSVLGLSFYSLLYYIYIEASTRVYGTPSRSVAISSGIYLITTAGLFGFLWLSRLLPSLMKGETPRELIDTGLFTNPVHVLDLGIVLPALFLTGLFLLREKPTGYRLAPVIFIFSLLMDLTICGLMIIMKYNGLDSEISVIGFTGMLALVSFVFLILLVRKPSS